MRVLADPQAAHRGPLWAVILAGGDGTRLASLTMRDGVPVPKQYCALAGPCTLLSDTLERAARLAPARRTVTVVAAAHRRWWQRDLDGSAVGVLAQPANRGTAAGILLPLLHVHARCPRAVLAIFPSDHYVERERALLSAVREAASLAVAEPRRVVLLGVRVEVAEPGYGWVVPGPRMRGRAVSVRAFVEKPAAVATEALLRAGALVNTFVLVGTAAAMLELFATAQAELLATFRRRLGGGAASDDCLAALYEETPCLDFSRDVLERVPDRLAMLPVPACGWTDLGTPERVAACLRRVASRPVTAGAP